MSNKNVISFAMFSSYAKEIEDHWKFKERHRKEVKFRSPQLQLRSHLVDWLTNISGKVNLSSRTVHLAVQILDVFMDHHSITNNRLGFVGLVCIMLAELMFLQYLPSQVAAACVLATRRQMSLAPQWTSDLTHLTGYSQENLTQLADLLLKIYKEIRMKKARDAQSPDLGYVSETP